MHYKNSLAFNIFMAIVLLFLAQTSLAQDAGTISAVDGYVTVTSANGETKRVEAGDTVQNGDVVNTGNESAATIVLANGKTITLGSLDSYTVNGGPANGEGDSVAPTSLNNTTPTLSTATSAGGSLITPTDDAPTTPTEGGSPTN